MASYYTVDEANTYFADRLSSEPWDASTNENRRKALAMATAIIDRLSYIGEKTDEDQTNEFPRDGDEDIPEDISKASAEIALALLDGVDPEMEFQNLFLASQGYSSIRASYDQVQPPPNIVAGIPSVTAWRYLLPYLRDPMEIKLNRTS